MNNTTNNTNTATTSVRVFNATPHAINIINNGVFDPAIRKYTTDAPEIAQSIPSNGMLSVQIETIELDPIAGIPIYGKTITGIDPLPGGYDMVVVSALYAANYVAIHGNDWRLYTVADPVYSSDGRTVLGCRGLMPYDAMGAKRDSYVLMMTSPDAVSVAEDITCGYCYKHICEGLAQMEVVSNGWDWRGVSVPIYEEANIGGVIQWLDSHGFHGIEAVISRETVIGCRGKSETVRTVIIGEE